MVLLYIYVNQIIIRHSSQKSERLQIFQQFIPLFCRWCNCRKYSRPRGVPPHLHQRQAHQAFVLLFIVRACRNAIEFNQIPSIAQIVPGGRDQMKLDVLLAVPAKYQAGLDFGAVRRCFPYGQVRIQLPSDGGMIASNGKVISEMGDTNDDMIVVCVAVTVGY